MSITRLDRREAVKRLSNYVADRDRFVIAIPFGDLASRIDAVNLCVEDWEAFVEVAPDLVVHTDDTAPFDPPGLIAATSAVLTVPKTTPAEVLGLLLGRDFPADGSQDLIGMDPGRGAGLLFEAAESVDPLATARVRDSSETRT